MNGLIKTLIVCSILVIGWIIPINFFVKNKTNAKLNPGLIFIFLWSFVVCLMFVYSPLIFSMTTRIEVILLLLSAFICVCFFSQGNVDVKTYKFNVCLILETNKKVIKNTVIVCLCFRFLQIIYDLYVLGNLGGNFSTLFSEAQWLRFAYLGYSRNQMTLSAEILVNVLNYVAELGVILTSLEVFFNKHYKGFIIAIVLSLLNTICTMSKFAFFLDLCFVFSVFILYINSFEKNEIDKGVKRMIRSLTLLFTVIMIAVLELTGTQRGYDEMESSIDGIDNITASKALAYFISPFMAFCKIVDEGVDFSYGSKTFSPFAKVLGVQYTNLGNIDIGLDETTVYTMPGMFYADFGMVGAGLLLIIFLYITSRTFYRVFSNFSLSCVGLYCVLNTLLIMSFFTWLGRMTFFWFFPFFVFMYDKLFLRYAWKK